MEQTEDRRQWQVALLCALVAVCDGFDTQAIAFVAPVMAKQWGVHAAGFGPIFSAGLLGLALGAFLFGNAADRFGRKAVILLCVTLFGVSSLLTTRSEGLAELAIWRILTGLGLGGVLPNLISLTNEAASPRLKNTLVMLMFCGFPLGATIGGLVSAPLIEAYGWKSVFILGGVLPLALLPALFLRLPAELEAAKPGSSAEASLPKGNIAELFRHRRAVPTLLIWTGFFCNLLVMYLLVSWLPSLLSMIGTSLSVATLSTAMLNLGGIVGALILSRLLIGGKGLLVLSCALVAGALALVLIAKADGNVAAMLIGAALAGTIIVGGQIAMNAITASFYPDHIRATGVGLALGVGRIGSIVGPLIGGLLLGAGWAGTSLILFAILPTLLAALALFALHNFISVADSQRSG
jgi:MFS transporter, AAHS family, 4-hydroxybenzoate transporter